MVGYFLLDMDSQASQARRKGTHFLVDQIDDVATCNRHFVREKFGGKLPFRSIENDFGYHFDAWRVFSWQALEESVWARNANKQHSSWSLWFDVMMTDR